jgi:hypothetical protein
LLSVVLSIPISKFVITYNLFQKKACQILYWILSNFIIRRVIFEQRFNCWAPSYSFFILEIAIKPKWGTVAAYVCSSRVDSTKRNLIRDYLVGSRSGPRTTALQCRRAIFGFAKNLFLALLAQLYFAY